MKNRRAVIKRAARVWLLRHQDCSTPRISMRKLRTAIELERRAQWEMNGADANAQHACRILEELWDTINGRTDAYVPGDEQ